MNEQINQYVSNLVDKLSCSKKRKLKTEERMKNNLNKQVHKLMRKSEGIDEEEATNKAINQFGIEELNVGKFLSVVDPVYIIYKVLAWSAMIFFSIMLVIQTIIPNISYRIQIFQIDAWNPDSMFGFSQWKENLQLVPFKSIYSLIVHWGEISWEMYTVFLSSAIIFLILSMFLPYISDSCRSYKNMMIVVLMLSVGIEIIQFVLQIGVTDIDDIILSLLAGSIGYWQYTMVMDRAFRMFNRF